MSLKRFSRAGLIALAGAMLLGLALSVPTFHSSYAQAPAATNPPAATAPAPDAAAPAAPAADAGPPACDGVKVTENCTPNSGDTAWMLTSGHRADDDASGPGAVLRRHGEQEADGDTVMTRFAITSLVTILWLSSPTAWRSAHERGSSAASTKASCRNERHYLQQRRRGAKLGTPNRCRRRCPNPSIRCSSPRSPSLPRR